MSKTDLKIYLTDPLSARLHLIGRVDGSDHLLEAVHQAFILLASFSVAYEGSPKAAERVYQIADGIVAAAAKGPKS